MKRKGGGGSDSGPVINEESNFQAGDLTSSRPTVAAGTQCEMGHETTTTRTVRRMTKERMRKGIVFLSFSGEE